MKFFKTKSKIIVIVGGIVFAILIIWYCYFYSPDYNFITDDAENDFVVEENIKEINNEVLENVVIEEKKSIAIHIARSRKERRSCRSR